MSINPSAEIISDALQKCYYTRFVTEEFRYINSHKGLTSTERQVWFELASLSRFDDFFAIAITIMQLAKSLSMSNRHISRAIAGLIAKQFLRSEFDAQRRVTVYYVQLDEIGLELVKRAKHRGERVNYIHPAYDERAEPTESVTRQECPVRDDKPVILDMTDLSPLINININKHNNKHLNHKYSDISTAAEATDAMIDADALVLRFDEALESIKAKNPGIRQVKANQLAREQFTEQELACINQYLRDKDEPEKPQAIKTEKPVQTASAPKKPLTENLVAFSIAGGCYLLEESVKTKALSQLQQMHERGRIKGEAENKQLETLIGEVFYYISKAGSLQEEVMSQSSKLNMAVHLLLKGDWQTPNGMLKKTIIAREQAWQRQKKAQGQYAPVSTWSRPYA